MTQTIEQLTARVRELEEFKANVVKECASIIKHAHKDIAKQLAASQAYAEQLREAIEQYLAENDPSEFGCACDPSVGHLCGPCFAHKQQTVLRKALALPRDTSALDAYVAEKVKIARDIDEKQIAYLFEERSTLTRQRDLAVEALNAWIGIASNCSIDSGVCCCGEAMKNHSSPMACGHSPVDMADSVVHSAIQKTDKALALPHDTSTAA